MFEIFTYGLVVLMIPVSVFAGVVEGDGDKYGVEAERGIGKVKVDREGYNRKRSKPKKTLYETSKVLDSTVSTVTTSLARVEQPQSVVSRVLNNVDSQDRQFLPKDSRRKFNPIAQAESISGKTDEAIGLNKTQDTDPVMPKLWSKKGKKPPREFRREVFNDPKKVKDPKNIGRVSESKKYLSTDPKVPRSVISTKENILLEEFKINYHKEEKKFYLVNRKCSDFIIPPPKKQNIKDIDKLFTENRSDFKKLVNYAAVQFAISYLPNGMARRLFNYSHWSDAQFRTYLEFGNTKKDSFFLARADFGKTRPKKYLLLSLDGDLRLIENANDSHTRFGTINEDLITNISCHMQETKNNGVPTWLVGLIPKFLEATYHKKGNSF